MATIDHFSDPRYLMWLKFWLSPWREMDDSWWERMPPAMPQNVRWQAVNPACIRALLMLEPVAPPMPGEALLQWIAMNASGRQSALILAAEVATRGSGAAMMSDDDVIWCRHLARALMPGRWGLADYPGLDAVHLGMLLLREWLSAPAWHRLCLCYPKAMVDTIADLAPECISGQRLNQLWHGVMWRLSVTHPVEASMTTAPSDQSEGMSASSSEKMVDEIEQEE